MKKVATYVRISTENATDDQTKQINDYCDKKGYTVCDSVSVIGDRKTGNTMFMELLKSANGKGIETIVMASTNRIVGTVDELQEIKSTIDESGVTIETLDGSYEAPHVNGLVASFLAMAQVENDEDDE